MREPFFRTLLGWATSILFNEKTFVWSIRVDPQNKIPLKHGASCFLPHTTFFEWETMSDQTCEFLFGKAGTFSCCNGFAFCLYRLATTTTGLILPSQLLQGWAQCTAASRLPSLVSRRRIGRRTKSQGIVLMGGVYVSWFLDLEYDGWCAPYLRLPQMKFHCRFHLLYLYSWHD